MIGYLHHSRVPRLEEETMGYKLLLADDSITIQKVVGIIFSTDAYDLTVVDNGNDALMRAREAVPDIMLIDALMPGKNGYEVCREARIDPLLATVPILLLSGVFEPFDEATNLLEHRTGDHAIRTKVDHQHPGFTGLVTLAICNEFARRGP